MKIPRKNNDLAGLLATESSPRPGDFETGSLKSRAAARTLIRKKQAAQLENLTPYQAAMAEGLPEGQKDMMAKLALIAEERARIFGLQLPTPDEIRQIKLAAAQIRARQEPNLIDPD
jgi:hypothetical protein